jgi:ubiquinone/menaquinone biosynthesis C-methylase UbiE
MDSPVQHVMQTITGYWQSQAVYVAAKLELADRLAGGAKTLAALAQETATHADTLFRLLRALASIGIFRESAPGTFENTPASEVLRKNAPGSQWAMAVMMGEEHYAAWGQLLHSVQTGRGGFAKVYGQRPFEYLAEHPEQAAVFDAAMTSVHGRETQPMVAAYDFSKARLVADIGGGNGSVITEVLRQNPHLRGLLCDLPHVVARAKENLVAAGVSERCDVVAGNFFEEIPGGADVYLFRHIIHDWLDDECVTILANCRRVMQPHSRVLLAETLVPPGNDFAFVKWLDLNMLAIPEGRERTLAEYERLFARAGLALIRIIDTPAEIHLIEAAPA